MILSLQILRKEIFCPRNWTFFTAVKLYFARVSLTLSYFMGVPLIFPILWTSFFFWRTSVLLILSYFMGVPLFFPVLAVSLILHNWVSCIVRKFMHPGEHFSLERKTLIILAIFNRKNSQETEIVFNE